MSTLLFNVQVDTFQVNWTVNDNNGTVTSTWPFDGSANFTYDPIYVPEADLYFSAPLYIYYSNSGQALTDSWNRVLVASSDTSTIIQYINGDGIADFRTSTTNWSYTFARPAITYTIVEESLTGLQSGYGTSAATGSTQVNQTSIFPNGTTQTIESSRTFIGDTYVSNYLFGIAFEAPLFSISGPAQVQEADSGLKEIQYTVSLNKPLSYPVSVFASTSALPLFDARYVYKGADITFEPGSTKKIFTVQIKGNTIPELDQSFSVSLSDPSATTGIAPKLGTSQAVTTITDGPLLPQAAAALQTSSQILDLVSAFVPWAAAKTGKVTQADYAFFERIGAFALPAEIGAILTQKFSDYNTAYDNAMQISDPDQRSKQLEQIKLQYAVETADDLIGVAFSVAVGAYTSAYLTTIGGASVVGGLEIGLTAFAASLGITVAAPAAAVVAAAGLLVLGLGAAAVYKTTISPSMKTELREKILLINGVVSGHALDGYLSGATVFSDNNDNQALDESEPISITDANGEFNATGMTGRLHALGGVDMSTGLPFSGVLLAPAGSKIISPLTTLASLVEEQGHSDPFNIVRSALGVSPSIDLSTYNPIQASFDGDPDGPPVFVAGAKAYDTAFLIGMATKGVGSTPLEATRGAFSLMAAAIIANTIKFDNIDSIGAILVSAARDQGRPIDEQIASSIASMIVATNIAIDDVAGSTVALSQQIAEIAAIQLVAQGAIVAAIQNASFDPVTIRAVAERFTGGNLKTLIDLAMTDLTSSGQNQIPLVSGLSIIGNEDTPVQGTLPAFDIDVDPLTYSIVSEPLHGTLTLDGSKFTYSAAANYSGLDSFTFRASDGAATSDLANVFISINPVQDPAIISGQLTGEVNEEGPFVASGQLSIEDPDQDDAGFQAASVPGAYGNLSIDGSGSWTYTLDNEKGDVQALDAGESLYDVIQIKSVDGTAASIQIQINGADEYNVISGTPMNDWLTGTEGDDDITPFGGADKVFADDGDDVIRATPNDGPDIYFGGDGSDTLDYSALTQSVNVRLANLFGGSGMTSGRQSGMDLLHSIENVIGTSADDRISGNGDINIIEGRSGKDTISGGENTDVFVFKPGFGNDRITDFDANPKGGQDLIELSGFGITVANFGQHVTIADIGRDTLITVDNDTNQTILLSGIRDATTVTVDDFRFA